MDAPIGGTHGFDSVDVGALLPLHPIYTPPIDVEACGDFGLIQSRYLSTDVPYPLPLWIAARARWGLPGPLMASCLFPALYAWLTMVGLDRGLLVP